MLLRASGETERAEVDLANVNGSTGSDGGVAHGAALVDFVDAVMGGDPAGLERQRASLRARLGDPAFVDTCAVIGAFNVVDRIADATGIPLDVFLKQSTEELRRELGLARFASAANTPGAEAS